MYLAHSGSFQGLVGLRKTEFPVALEVFLTQIFVFGIEDRSISVAISYGYLKCIIEPSGRVLADADVSETGYTEL